MFSSKVLFRNVERRACVNHVYQFLTLVQNIYEPNTPVKSLRLLGNNSDYFEILVTIENTARSLKHVYFVLSAYVKHYSYVPLIKSSSYFLILNILIKIFISTAKNVFRVYLKVTLFNFTCFIKHYLPRTTQSICYARFCERCRKHSITIFLLYVFIASFKKIVRKTWHFLLFVFAKSFYNAFWQSRDAIAIVVCT